MLVNPLHRSTLLVLPFLTACLGTTGLPGEPGRPGDEIAGPSGIAGPDGSEAPRLRTRVTEEPAGENCEYGGLRVDTVLDSEDGSSVEESSTPHFVCDGTPDIFYGSFIVTSPADLAELNRWKTIIGNVIIDARTPGFGNIELSMAAVVGAMLIMGDAEQDQTLSAPFLETASMLIVRSVQAIHLPGLKSSLYAGFGGEGKLSSLEVPSLRLVNALNIAETSLRTLSLPSLVKADERFLIGDNSRLETIELPSLVELGGDGLYVAYNPTLRSIAFDGLLKAGRVTINKNDSLQSASFPKLQSVIENLSISYNNELVQVDVPMLERFDEIRVQYNQKLSTCTFEEIAANTFTDRVYVNNNKPVSCPSYPGVQVRLKDNALSTRWVAYSRRQSFDDARTTCQNAGGELASFTSYSDYRGFEKIWIIHGLPRFNPWVGYKYFPAYASFNWTGSSSWRPASGEFWQADSPPSSGCAVLVGESTPLRAVAYPCTSTERFICEIPIPAGG